MSRIAGSNQSRRARRRSAPSDEVNEACRALLTIDPRDKDYPKAWAAFVRPRRIGREMSSWRKWPHDVIQVTNRTDGSARPRDGQAGHSRLAAAQRKRKDDVNTIEMDRELTLEELEIVSGGLNPQPLPPRWGEPGIRLLNPQPLPPG